MFWKTGMIHSTCIHTDNSYLQLYNLLEYIPHQYIVCACSTLVQYLVVNRFKHTLIKVLHD